MPRSPRVKMQGDAGVDAEIDPAVLEPPRVVEGQRHGLPVVEAVQAGEHPELDEELEAVADAEDQLSRGDEPGELIEEPFPASGDGRMEDPVRAGLGGAEVVAVEKSAGQIQEVVIVEPLRPAEQLADVDDIDLVEAGEAAGVGHFHLAVRAVSRDDDRTDFLRHSSHLCYLYRFKPHRRLVIPSSPRNPESARIPGPRDDGRELRRRAASARPP